MSKKRSPAYYRYKEKHPVISAVLTDDLKEKLDNYKGEMSYGQGIKKLVSETFNSYQNGYKAGYEEGLSDGIDKVLEDLYIDKKPEDRQVLRRLLKQQLMRELRDRDGNE